jgi:hypothetical protein
MKIWMKSGILDPEDAGLLRIGSFRKNLRNNTRPRMWFKRQFFVLRGHFSSRRI